MHPSFVYFVQDSSFHILRRALKEIREKGKRRSLARASANSRSKQRRRRPSSLVLLPHPLRARWRPRSTRLHCSLSCSHRSQSCSSSPSPRSLQAAIANPDFLGRFALTTSLALFLTYAFQHLILRPYFSPLYDLPGPPRASIVLGNLKRVFSEEPGKVHDEWAETYGGVVRYGGAYGVSFAFVGEEEQELMTSGCAGHAAHVDRSCRTQPHPSRAVLRVPQAKRGSR
mgnify:FL=1